MLACAAGRTDATPPRVALTSPVPQDGWMPLHRASFTGHLAVVGALLAKGADVQAKDEVSIARACALCSTRSHTHMQNAHGYLCGMCVYVCLSCCLSRRRFGCQA
jgi:hypothetical protein